MKTMYSTKTLKKAVASLATAFFFTALAAGQTVGTDIGQIAPEIEIADTKGKVIKLSSLRGQVVLIDFWASWCGPCRYENPTVVKAYNTFKDKTFNEGKGFTVYSVSLDVKQANWIAAIEKDGLTWPCHVCDYGGWYGATTRKYGVNSIPSNFLIDGKGVIVAKNLRGAALQSVLQQMVKQ